MAVKNIKEPPHHPNPPVGAKPPHVPSVLDNTKKYEKLEHGIYRKKKDGTLWRIEETRGVNPIASDASPVIRNEGATTVARKIVQVNEEVETDVAKETKKSKKKKKAAKVEKEVKADEARVKGD